MPGLSLGGRGTGEHMRRTSVPSARPEPSKKPIDKSRAWNEARDLIWVHRRRLAIGLGLMLVSRLAGLVLPASSKWLIDEVIGKKRYELLGLIAFASGAATLVQAVTSFALSQILGVAAQRAPVLSVSPARCSSERKRPTDASRWPADTAP